jgi:hypothetical protein
MNAHAQNLNSVGHEARPFDCQIQPHNVRAVGTITHVRREGWAPASEHYVVDAALNGRTFRFTMRRDRDRWLTEILSARDGQTVANVYTFQYANRKIEFLFEEALVNLAIFNEDADAEEIE